MVSGKPFDMPTFSALKNAGLLFWNSGMRGQLWEECYCGTEPVCAMCMKCSRHCTCGGGGWALTEKGIEAVIQKGFQVSVNGSQIKSIQDVSVAMDIEKKRLESERVAKIAARNAKIAELESRGIYVRENAAKGEEILKKWQQGMSHAGWDVSLKDIDVIARHGGIEFRRSIEDAREPRQYALVTARIFGMETKAVINDFYNMDGYSETAIFLPDEIISKIKPLIEKRDAERRAEEEKRQIQYAAEAAKRQKEYEEKVKKEAEARACKEKEDVVKIASIAESLSSLTKNQILSKYSQLVNEEIIMKSWPKDKLIAKISEVSVKGKFKKTSRSRDEDYETGDYGGY